MPLLMNKINFLFIQGSMTYFIHPLHAYSIYFKTVTNFLKKLITGYVVWFMTTQLFKYQKEPTKLKSFF